MIEGSKERYSTALFSYHKGIIDIPQELVDEQHPLRFHPFNHYGLLGYFSTHHSDKMPSTANAYCGVWDTLYYMPMLNYIYGCWWTNEYLS